MSDSSDVLLRRIHQVALRSDLRIALARNEPLRASLQACAETIVRHIGAPVAAIWWAGDAMLELTACAGTRDPAPPREIRRGEGPLGALVEDVTYLVDSGFVAYPLLGASSVLGVLGIYTDGPVAPELVDELGWVADVISVSLESRGLAEQCEKANRVVTLQMRVAEALAGGGSYGSALGGALRTIAEDLGCGLGVYWQVDRDLVGRVVTWRDDDPRSALWENAVRAATGLPELSLPGRAIRSREPVGDAGGLVLEGFPLPERDAPTSGVAVAVRADDEVIGVLGFFDGAGRGGDDDLSALATLAGLITQYIQRRRAEERLAQSQKLEAVGKLAGGIAHDFNNVLTVIQGWLEVAVADPAVPESTRSQLGDGLEAARRAAGLVRQLLAFSKNQVFERRVIDLNPIVVDLDRMLHRIIGDHVRMRTTVPEHPSMVHADRVQIEQIVVNLVINARDAMPDGGDVHIELAHVDERPEPGEEPAGPCVMLAVSDTGTGMSEEVQRRAFDPFFTTKEVGKGTGLGLATVYGVVRQMGGAVRLESEPQRGTRVVVLLPRLSEAAVARHAEQQVPVQHAGGTALIVEDEAHVRRLMRSALAGAGFRVLEAGSGATAVTQFAAAGGEVDVLVADVQMPGMSGVELARRLQAKTPRLAVLYTSGFVEGEGCNELANPDQFLPKPFTPTTLVQRVREVLARAGRPPRRVA